MTDVTIRAMQEGDRETVTDLLWQLNLHEQAIVGNRATDREAAAASLAANDERKREHGGIQLVAELDGRVVGYCCCVVDIAPPYIRADDRRHVWVAELVVDQTLRGLGVGSSLLKAGEDFARAQGLRHMLIGSVAGNDGADRLYARMGYRLYSNERLKTLD